MGDVAGKGAQASLIMASVKAYLSAAMESNLDFVTISNNLNKFLARNTPLDKFITIFLGLINLKENKITYINSGHEPGVIISIDGKVNYLHSNNIMMGVLEDFEYIPTEILFPENSFLFIYTDGVTEANNKDDDRFGTERLMNVLQMHQKNPEKIIEALPASIEQFSFGKMQFDDITFLIVIRGDKLLRNNHFNG